MLSRRTYKQANSVEKMLGCWCLSCFACYDECSHRRCISALLASLGSSCLAWPAGIIRVPWLATVDRFGFSFTHGAADAQYQGQRQ